jgi:hypothetical protein
LGFGNKSDNEGVHSSGRKPDVRKGLNEYFGAKNRSNPVGWRNKSLTATQ